MNISLALMHMPLTSASVKFTYFPGLDPLTDNNFSITLSMSNSWAPLLVCLSIKIFDIYKIYLERKEIKFIC
jgi:hypothetical protein